MQTDGNFVIYDGSNRPRWMRRHGPNVNTRLVLQGDGNLVVYTPKDGHRGIASAIPPAWSLKPRGYEVPEVRGGPFRSAYPLRTPTLSARRRRTASPDSCRRCR